MALTRITKGVIKPNENYDTHNIHSTGIVTAIGLDVNGNADVSGSLSVGGVLTYEDVTSIDSVGIITARTGLVSPYADIDDFIDVGSNIKLGNAGVITATSFVGSGAALTGIDATAIKDPGGNVKIQAQASGAVHTGIATFQDIDVDGHTNLDNVNVSGIITSAAATVNGETILNGNVSFYGANYGAIWRKNNSRFQINDNAELTFGTSNDTTIKHNNSNLLITNTTGNIDVTGNVVLNNDLDVDGHTNLDNVSIAGVTTFAENAKAVFGNSGELEIFRSGTESAIVETQGNNLNLAGNRVNL